MTFGKIIASPIVLILKIIASIPVIGDPLARALESLLTTMLKLLMNAHWILGGLFVTLVVLSLLGII